MIKKFQFYLILAGIILSIATLGFAMDKIVIEGTGDSQALLRILAAEFEKIHPEIRVEVLDSIGSTAGIKALAEGKCDLARSARPLKDGEKKYNLNYLEFAYSPIVMVVNLGSKEVSSLSTEQIIGIFSGRIRNWKELGGEQQSIYVFNREPGDSSRVILEEKISGMKEIKEYPGKTIYSTPEMVSTLVKYDGVIGYLPLTMVKNTGLTVLKVDGVYPSAENLQNGSYGLKVRFSLLYKGELKGKVKSFVDFILSPRGRELMFENGAVPVQ
jgi:phosphate transport system substrate-binding protein